ncbi:MAG: hypothetical protein ABIJ23_00760 [Candidatus Magasanikbacteria bacterium]
MTEDFEQQWAKTIKKSKQGQVVTRVNSNLQKKQIKEELDYFKQKLWQALEQKNQEATKDILKKLIKTRSRLLKLLLSQRNIDQEKELENYYHDCFSVTKIASKLLSK